MFELKHNEEYEMDYDYDKDIFALFDSLNIDILLTLYFYADLIKIIE